MIGYLGREGSYSYHAGATFYVAEELVPYKNIGRLFYALEQDEVQGIIVPFENSTYGTSFDVLRRVHNRHYHITREIVLDLMLTVVSDSYNARDIHFLYATEESINESYNTLKTQIGSYEKRYVTSNKSALTELEHCEEENGAALVSVFDNKGDYNIVLNDVRDSDENIHRFVMIEKSLKVTGFHNRTLIACSPKANRVGALHDLLHEFAFRDIDVVKVLSIPTSSSDDLKFYFELAGNLEETNMIEALAMLKQKSSFVSILGSYYVK